MTLQEFTNAINQNPFDWELRLVFSDFLEENGDLVRAEGQRYQAFHKKYPQYWLGTKSYDWWDEAELLWESVENHAKLDTKIYKIINKKYRNTAVFVTLNYCNWIGWRTREEAEYWLALALLEQEEKCS